MEARDVIVLVLVLGGAIWLLGPILRITRRNTESPLQRRLADLMAAYAQSDHDEAAIHALKLGLDQELDQNRVPREERQDRLIGAGMLAGRTVKGAQARALIAALKKLGIMR